MKEYQPLNQGEMPFEQYVDVEIQKTKTFDFTTDLVAIWDAESDFVAFVQKDKADLFVRLFNTYEPIKEF